ncbi:MAG: delta-lactam-biosynthetic de-N-acetylase [Clostridia bacterium]|nr:delta-lactam-biosynthetic de-N-acetylase [Clostridia bacterium]
MSKRIVFTILIGAVIVITYTAFSFLKIRANRQLPVFVNKYDEDRSVKFPETIEDSIKKEKALKELAEAIKKQEEGLPDKEEKNTDDESRQDSPDSCKVLDYEKLKTLSATRLAWWIKLNSEHKPTTISQDIQDMISEYDGIYIGDISQKKIYLTFDEGYENGYTSKILNTLKENSVKAAFFVTSPYIKGNSGLVKRMIDEGHVVGNHTMRHPSLPSLKAAELENELLGLEKQFKEMFGTGFKYMRPPRGEYSERVLAASKQLGYKTAFWSYAYKDFDVSDQKGADYAYKKVMDNLHNGAVILLHAVSKDNADALDRIIKDAKSQGYEFSPFDL